MKTIIRFLSCVASIVLLAVGAAMAHPAAPLVVSATQAAPATLRDGQHDFDFLFGKWKEHFKRLRHPLSGSHDWYEFDGISNVRPLWGGKGNVEDGELFSPKGRVDGLTLRLYNPKTHEWSLYWGTAANGLSGGSACPTGATAQVGHFDQNGVGEFFDKDTFGGKPVIVRYKWTHGQPNEWHFEQAFSDDNGKTWETNWISDSVEKLSS